MSKFVTSIKVDIDGAKRALPKGAYFHGVQAGLGFESIDLVWEHDQLVTPFDYPVPFDLEHLKAGVLPNEVRRPDAKPSAPKPAPKSADPILLRSELRRTGTDPILLRSELRRTGTDPTTEGKKVRRAGRAGVKQRA